MAWRARRTSPCIVTHGTLRALNKLSTSVVEDSFWSQPASISTASAGRVSALASLGYAVSGGTDPGTLVQLASPA
jgi:hypothetical protein